MRLVSAEVARWRNLASAIADPAARRLALSDLDAKRSYLNGAAFFNNLVPYRSAELVRLLVAFQVLANYLDTVSERDAQLTGRRPRPWASMLHDAVDLDRTPRSYLYGAVGPEGHYLRQLVRECRGACARLPAYRLARPLVSSEVRLAATLDLEHDPCPTRRDRSLHRFVHAELGTTSGLTWWEAAAGTSSALTVLVVLALAADQGMCVTELQRAVDAYRFVAALSALLDNYVDQAADRAHGSNNHILNHGGGTTGAVRLTTLIDRTLGEVSGLRNGSRHVLLTTMMLTMFLSADEARESTLRNDTRMLIRAGGATTRLLLPALRVWRVAHRQPGG